MKELEVKGTDRRERKTTRCINELNEVLITGQDTDDSAAEENQGQKRGLGKSSVLSKRQLVLANRRELERI